MFKAIQLGLMVAGLSGTASLGALARFDFFSEGFIGPTLTDGGIDFYDLDNRLEPTPWFDIERANGTLQGPFPQYFSPPNALSWGPMLQVGPLTGFWRCGSFRFRAAGRNDFASLELFDMSNVGGNTVTLRAYLGSILVNSMSVTLLPPPGIHHYTLSVSGMPFDSLQLYGSGPTNQGCFFAVADNFLITPEPLSALALAALSICCRRR